MMLDGKAAQKENDRVAKGEVHLDKNEQTDFEDEWDFVIDNYTVGGNDPEIIDSINAIAQLPVRPAEELIGIKEETPKIIATEKPAQKETVPPEKINPVIEKPQPVVKPAEPLKAPTIEEKFVTRQKVFIKEIPVSGDSIELRFYDNAEIDGDSISLFLNDKLLFQHIKLTANAYAIKLAVKDLNERNELVMVAENMGAIPPNTSYMVAIVNGHRQDAYLASTEGSSAMIQFVKAPPKN